MSITGKKIRLERIMNKSTQKMVIVPMDHGVAFGPIEGLEDMPKTIEAVSNGGANAVLIHKGLVAAGFRGFGRDLGLIIHLNASTSLSQNLDNRVMVSSVEEALGLGADAVSIQINVGAENDGEMLQDLGEVADSCDQWGMPLIAMMYPRGTNIKNPHDVDLVKQVARLGAELGADIIKTNYTGDIDSFKEVVHSCPVPIIVAGGPKMNSDKELLEMIRDAVEAGAAGTAIGRNIFQHDYVTGVTGAISKIVHEGFSVEDAIALIKR